jgi:hypothetical protein
MRNVEPSFDERKFGFGSLVDLLRAAQREGLFRMERDRQGSVRLFPGPAMQTPSVRPPVDDDNRGNIAEPANVQETDEATGEAWMPEAVPPRGDESEIQSEVVDGAVVQELDVAPVIDAEEVPQEQASSSSEQPPRGRRPARSGRAPRKPQEAGAPRVRKATSPKPHAARAPRSRKDVPQ